MTHRTEAAGAASSTSRLAAHALTHAHTMLLLIPLSHHHPVLLLLSHAVLEALHGTNHAGRDAHRHHLRLFELRLECLQLTLQLHARRWSELVVAELMRDLHT